MNEAASRSQEHTDPLRAADDFLAACVRTIAHGGSLPGWPQVGTNGGDENAFATAVVSRAEFHGIALLLVRADLSAAGWPNNVSADLAQHARLAGLWEELHRPRIAALIEELADRDIASLVLKGTALAYQYHPDPAIRRRGDTDLLVRLGDLAQVREVLRASGWISPADNHGLYFQESWRIDCGLGMEHTLDLHWQPADRPVIQKVLRHEDFWSHPKPLTKLSPRALAPDPVIMLIHAAINQFWHETRGFHVEDQRIVGGRRLIWALDYHYLTQQLNAQDWESLVALACGRDAGAILAEVLAGAVADIGLAIPCGILERLRPANGRSPTLEYIRSFDRIKDIRADLMAAESTGAKLRLLWSSVTVSRAQLVAQFPDQAHWPTALLQVRRYAGALSRVLGFSPRGAAYHLEHAPEKRGR